MKGLGTIINVAAVVLGSLIGILLRGGIPKVSRYAYAGFGTFNHFYRNFRGNEGAFNPYRRKGGHSKHAYYDTFHGVGRVVG